MANRAVNQLIACSGALICARNTNRVLLLQKREGKHSGRWGLVGGTNELHETPWQGFQREVEEEIGFIPEIIKTFPLEKFVSADERFNFTTYFCIVNNEFVPQLSVEHIAWGWFDLNNLPKPIHHGFNLSIQSKIIKSKVETIFNNIDNF